MDLIIEGILHGLQMIALFAPISIAGSSLAQTRVVMPTITDKALSTATSTQLNHRMLQHAHWFFLPLNTVCLVSNVLVTLIWLVSTFQTNTNDLLSLHAIRALAPAMLCVIATVDTVRNILPINERIHQLGDELEKPSDSKMGAPESKAGEEAEIRSLQRQWSQRNTSRIAILSVTAIASATSPAVVSFYQAMA